MSYLGDYAEDFADLNTKFTTRQTSGAPFTLAGTPAVSVYKSNDTVQSTAGVTLTVDFDSVTGLNNVKIDLSADAFYATGADYQVVITAGTVNGVSVVGEVVAEFSIQNRYNDVNTASISGSTEAADNLEASAETIVVTTVNDASATTTSFVTALTEATDDHYVNRIITFTSGALQDQSTKITDYVGSTKTVTVQALTEAPANGDGFVIL